MKEDNKIKIENEQLRNEIQELKITCKYLEKRNEELVQLLYVSNQYIKEKRL
jgi:hypothetical protein